MSEYLKKRKRKNLKNTIWFLAALTTVLIVIALMLLYKPPASRPPKPVHDKYVSKYLTHVLSPQFYNGLQRQEPFEMIIPQRGINDIIVHSKWPRQYDSIVFLTPNVFFAQDSIVIIQTIAIKALQFAVTIVVEPYIDRAGRLNLKIEQVKIGTVNATTLAKTIAQRMYHKRIEQDNIDANDIRTQIIDSLLNDKPFEPVLEFDDRKVRIEKVNIKQKELTLRFVPVQE